MGSNLGKLFALGGHGPHIGQVRVELVQIMTNCYSRLLQQLLTFAEDHLTLSKYLNSLNGYNGYWLMHVCRPP